MYKEFLKNVDKKQTKDSKLMEKDIENAFVRYAESKGCKALKLVKLRARGFPDRTILTPGARIFFIEFKLPGGNLTAPQKIVRKTLKRFDFEYYICNNIKDSKAVLNCFLANRHDFV